MNWGTKSVQDLLFTLGGYFVVFAYIDMLEQSFSANVLALFKEFRDKVTSNADQLFVMVVDEAHHAAVRRGAHDAFANDFQCKTADGKINHRAWRTGKEYVDIAGEWGQYQNLVTLLVSATPACLLTADSRVPRQYYVPNHLSAKQTELAGAANLHQFSIIKADGASPHGTKLEATIWKSGEHPIEAADLKELITNKV